VVRNTRLVKKTNQSTTESRYYLSSAPPEQYRPEQWLALIRGHWAGVEVRNHWRRDVLFGEDGSRTRNPNALGNMALIRSALCAVLAEHFSETPGPQILEHLNQNTAQCLRVLGA
jgi:predicted transposase YbfD/YdcC